MRTHKSSNAALPIAESRDVLSRNESTQSSTPSHSVPTIADSNLSDEEVTPSTSTSQQSPSLSHKQSTVGATAKVKHDDVSTKTTVRMAIKNNLKVYTIPVCKNEVDPIICMQSNMGIINSILLENLNSMNHGVKWYINIGVEFSKINSDGIIQTTISHFNGKNRILHDDSDIESNFRESMAKVLSSLNTYQRKGSNWVISKVVDIKLHVSKYKAISGTTFISTPTELGKKHAIINVQNNDNKCFMYAVLSALFPQQTNKCVMSKYISHANHLKFGSIKFPVKISDIAKFEKLNNITINVLAYDEDIFPLRITENRGGRKHINLLLLSKGDIKHYCYIKNMSALLRAQRDYTHKLFYCDYCLHGFRSEDNQKTHTKNCQRFGAQKTRLPDEQDRFIRYKNTAKQMRHPFVIYADFECIITKIQRCDKDSNLSSTDKIAEHTPCGFSYKLVGYNDNTTEDIVSYRGHDAAHKFIEEMEAIQNRIIPILYNEVKLVMTHDTEIAHAQNNICHICEELILFDKVKDHCHLTGKYVGPAHNKCNVNYKLPKYIPVIFHNLKGYDSHILLNALRSNTMKISCIPINMEKYMSFTLGRLRFIDSLQFLSASLAKLVDNLDTNEFHYTKDFIDTQYNETQESKLKLLTSKGVYPYEYMDTFDKFNDEELPTIEAFYSNLTKHNITVDDYAHAKKVWNIFNISNMGEYHDLYMTTDVLLLVDVFEKFRKMCLNYYKLDPCHYFTSPGLSWDACLKMTKIELELITDIDQHIFIESGVRGGVATIPHRHSVANNPYINGYDPSIDTSYIMYVDSNNLYGWSMMEFLPVNGFRWMSDKEIDALNIINIANDNCEGYIFEVDLIYPNSLHNLHNDFPLAPEQLNVEMNMLSDYQIKLGKLFNITNYKSIKLIPNLNDKKKYIVHYRNLQLYISLGMCVSKVYRVLTFKQSPWMRKYIEFNTNKRRECKTQFEKDFFKLLNNSIYGKSLQNQRKQVNIQLVNNEKQLLRLTAKPGFKSFKIFSDYLAAVQCVKENILLNKPIYVGFTILELSKCLMYNFHYNVIKKQYGDGAKLLFTDTDSLCYNIKTIDIYQDMKKCEEEYDFSDYPKTHMLFNESNKKVVGKFKDETNSVPIEEFVGLRTKMYSLKYDKHEKRVAKGISTSVIKEDLTHKMFKETLFNTIEKLNTMIQFRSYNHVIYTIQLNKKSLSAYDDKRYILKDGVTTLAYGHYSIQ